MSTNYGLKTKSNFFALSNVKVFTTKGLLKKILQVILSQPK